MAAIHARIIDLREDRFVALVGDEAREFARPPELAPKVGDIAEIDGGSVRIIGGVAEGAWDAEGDPLRWRRPGARASRMRYLRERQEIVRAIREYLRSEGFLEAQAPLLLRRTTPDAFINSMKVGENWLTTSTEYQIKRLQTGGFDSVYTLGPNFRDDAHDKTHNPEFTMLEWNRAFVGLEAVERDIERFALAALEAIAPGKTTVAVGGSVIDLMPLPWPRMTVREAWKQHLGIDVAEDFSLASLQSEVRKAGIEVSEMVFADRGSLVTFLLDRAQPFFGAERPLFLHEWPSFQTSTAAPCAHNPHACERSELYIGGLEIANGFVELRDPRPQAENFALQNEIRRAEGRETIPPDDKYIETLRLGLPPSAGIALGVDRLVMALTGAEHIRDVLAFSWDER